MGLGKMGMEMVVVVKVEMMLEMVVEMVVGRLTPNGDDGAKKSSAPLSGNAALVRK